MSSSESSHFLDKDGNFDLGAFAKHELKLRDQNANLEDVRKHPPHRESSHSPSLSSQSSSPHDFDDEQPFDLGDFATQELNNRNEYNSQDRNTNVEDNSLAPFDSSQFLPDDEDFDTSDETSSSSDDSDSGELSRPRIVNQRIGVNIKGINMKDGRKAEFKHEDFILIVNNFAPSAAKLGYTNFAKGTDQNQEKDQYITVLKKSGFWAFDIYMKYDSINRTFQFITRKEKDRLKLIESQKPVDKRVYSTFYIRFGMTKQSSTSHVAYLYTWAVDENIAAIALGIVFDIIDNIRYLKSNERNDKFYRFHSIEGTRLTKSVPITTSCRISGYLPFQINMSSFENQFISEAKHDTTLQTELSKLVNFSEIDDSNMMYKSKRLIVRNSNDGNGCGITALHEDCEKATYLYRFAERYAVANKKKLTSAQYYPPPHILNGRSRFIGSDNINDIGFKRLNSDTYKQKLLQDLIPFFSAL